MNSSCQMVSIDTSSDAGDPSGRELKHMRERSIHTSRSFKGLRRAHSIQI